jgi:hypothetical protein
MHAITASILTSALALFSEAGFVPIGGHHGVSVFQHKGAAAIELAAVGEIDAPPAEVEAVLLDYGNASRMIDRLAESRILERKPGEIVVYQHLKLPVIKDRDFTLHVTFDDHHPRGLRFRIDNTRGPGEKKGLVRMTMLNGRWDLEPIREGQATRATYHVQLDFAGSVPRWMVAGGAAKDLPKLYEGIRRAVAEHQSGIIGASSSR